MFTLLVIFISIPECGAVRTGVVDDGSAAQSYTLFGRPLNKVIDTVASTQESNVHQLRASTFL